MGVEVWACDSDHDEENEDRGRPDEAVMKSAPILLLTQSPGDIPFELMEPGYAKRDNKPSNQGHNNDTNDNAHTASVHGTQE